MTDEMAFMFLGFFVILWRLDRLGKQLEAVCTNIKVELTPDDDRKRELINEWKESTGGGRIRTLANPLSSGQ
jgi:hypothetical protein